MPLIPRLVVATANPGKLAEFRQLLEGLAGEVISSQEVAAPEIVEDLPTLEGNAAKKARTLHALTGLPAIGDDTGLEVAALDGRPGVYSARYAGPDGNAQANMAKLLVDLAPHANRSARFRTAIVFVDAHGERTYEGICSGRILSEPRGKGGFGYDPLFLPDGHDGTFAELPATIKNQISHRGRAMQAFLKDLSTW